MAPLPTAPTTASLLHPSLCSTISPAQPQRLATSFLPLSLPPLSYVPPNVSASSSLLPLSGRRRSRAGTASASSSTVEIPGTQAETDFRSALLPFRVGHGFDLHRLEPGLKLIIGGVDIPHDRGCEAHSDGDVLLHCVVDAILGALGLPDIGQLFPDNDPKWKGAPSNVFVEEAVRRMKLAGYRIGNLDATIILQRPKLSPHKPQIKANLCSLLQAPEDAVNVKAKTHEKVDSLGENRSVACHTVVLLIRDDQS